MIEKFFSYSVYFLIFSIIISFLVLIIGILNHRRWARLIVAYFYSFIAIAFIVTTIINFLYCYYNRLDGFCGAFSLITIPAAVIFGFFGLLLFILKRRWARLMLVIIFLIFALVSLSACLGIFEGLLSHSSTISGYGVGSALILLGLSLLFAILTWALLKTKLED